ncbi:unnamed protein product [Brugia timori]|uniref:Uncharacterized protein n=1 Tax=Brugia timori TaxID=42155 RepID=A0A0R3QZ91_9BILA|nr:unnamed protein product [Brugia timori]
MQNYYERILKDGHQKTYPNPRLNFSQCHTWPGSALCDPDHILTDQWRLDINNNINLQNSRCRQNDTKPPLIYVILAKRIQTQMNQTIATSEDALVNFGNKIVKEFDLKSEFCSNFIIVLGVADAKKVFIQVRFFFKKKKNFFFKMRKLTKTGQDLELPDDFLSNTSRKYDDLFNARNHMEGLNNRQITAQSIIIEDTAIEMKKTKAQPESVEPILASMHARCTSIQDSIIIAIRFNKFRKDRLTLKSVLQMDLCCYFHYLISNGMRFYHIISQLFSTVRTENLWRGKYKSERKCGKERNNTTATAYFDTKD